MESVNRKDHTDWFYCLRQYQLVLVPTTVVLCCVQHFFSDVFLWRDWIMCQFITSLQLRLKRLHMAQWWGIHHHHLHHLHHGHRHHHYHHTVRLLNLLLLLDEGYITNRQDLPISAFCAGDTGNTTIYRVSGKYSLHCVPKKRKPPNF